MATGSGAEPPGTGSADLIDMSTHTTHKTVQMARRYARPTAEQFQRAAAKRLAGQNKAGTGDGTADGSTELPTNRGEQPQ